MDETALGEMKEIQMQTTTTENRDWPSVALRAVSQITGVFMGANSRALQGAW